MRKRELELTREGQRLFWTPSTHPFPGKAYKVKVASMLYGELVTSTFLKQKTPATSHDGKKRDLDNNKKGFSSINKERPEHSKSLLK